MDMQDLDEARAVHAALLDLFASHAGGRDDPVALARVERLCELVIREIDDLALRVSLRGIKAYAALFFSADGASGTESGSLSGADFLRLRIYNELSNLRGRLNALEAERRRSRAHASASKRGRQSEPPALSAASHPGERAARAAKILVVEDNRDSAESLRRLLFLCGHEVSVAFTGAEGLRAARRLRPDVVLCDLGLPDTSGFAVASALRGDPETAGVRLIAVTAYGRDEDRRRALAVGFDLHLAKPVDPDVLLRNLR